MKRLKSFIDKNFKKVRIIDKPDKAVEELYNKRRLLRTKTDADSVEELEDVDKELGEKYLEVMFRKIMSEVKGADVPEEGEFNAGKLWKLRHKLAPRYRDPPTAMVNAEGKLLTSDKDILKEAEEHYKQVFKEKPILEEHTEYKHESDDLCKTMLEECSKIKTPEWTIIYVTVVLNNLKTGKSKDVYD